MVLAEFKSLLRALYLNPDVASAPVMSSLIGSAGADPTVTLSNWPWYEQLWFMELTKWLPAHRQVWELAPFLFSTVAVALVVWMAWHTFGPWAAAMAGTAIVCASIGMRAVLFTLNTHGATVLHGVVLGATLVFLDRRGARVSRRLLFALGVVLAVFTAAGETDRLTVVCGIVPFVATAGLAWWRTGLPAQRRIAVFAVVTAAAGLLGGELATASMRDAHIIAIGGFHVSFVPAGALVNNVQILITAFSHLGGGDFFGVSVDAAGLLLFAAGFLTLLAATLVLRWLWRAAPSLAGPAAEAATAPARQTYIAFWGLTLISVIVAFVISSTPVDTGSSRYLASAFVAVAALLPALAPSQPRLRALLVIGLTTFAVLAVRTDLVAGQSYGSGPNGGDAGQLEQYAVAHGLKYGYAGYQDAPVLSWETHLRLQVFPLYQCLGSLCPFPLHTISTWYRPRPHTRTFLIAEPAANYTALGGPFPAAGPPVETARFGNLQFFVYDHDIAADLGH